MAHLKLIGLLGLCSLAQCSPLPRPDTVEGSVRFTAYAIGPKGSPDAPEVRWSRVLDRSDLISIRNDNYYNKYQVVYLCAAEDLPEGLHCKVREASIRDERSADLSLKLPTFFEVDREFGRWARQNHYDIVLAVDVDGAGPIEPVGSSCLPLFCTFTPPPPPAPGQMLSAPQDGEFS